MKNKKLIKIRKAFVLGLVLTLTLGCERDLTDEAVPATFAREGEVFTDNFVGMGSDFYLPFGGSKLDAFSVDTEEGYESSASYRIDVPNDNDPTGNYAGAILRVDGAGRDLSGYDALTFWAKASQGVSVDAIGFGQDFFENKFQVNANNFSIGTNWAKYTIPIPDPSKLVEERGVFWYAAGTQATGGFGYVVWFDDIQFEKLGTVAQPRPAIQNGEDVVTDSFIGVTAEITGLTQTFNLASGLDQTVAPTASYYDFTSSNPGVASVDAAGIVTVNSGGTAVITATLDGIEASGSLTINSLGDFELAPTPTRNPNKVTAIYSDFYETVPVDFFNGFWEPYQTTLSSDFVVNGDNILNYTNFNFVGNQFANPTVDATVKSNLHLDMYIPGELPSLFDFLISVVNFGPDQVDGGGDDTRQQIFINASDVVANSWISLDLPITLANRDNIGLIIYENINFATLSNFYLDNIYFYEISTEPDVAAPTPTVPEANVISIFSDAYTNVSGSNLNPDWGQGTVVTEESIDGNNTLKYSGLNYQGLQLGTAQDVSGMTHLHIDYYSVNSTALNAYLISSGPVETAKALVVPTLGWTSLEIPLADFNPVNLADIIQFKFDGNGDIYLDNMYFHN